MLIALAGERGCAVRYYPMDDDVRQMWKKYPVRLSGMSESRCCGKPTVLVQSMEGGFVTRNCPECGRADTLSEHTFRKLGFWVACPKCRGPMTATRLEYSNYGYVCEHCDIAIKLADLLPKWSDL